MSGKDDAEFAWDKNKHDDSAPKPTEQIQLSCPKCGGRLFIHLCTITKVITDTTSHFLAENLFVRCMSKCGLVYKPGDLVSDRTTVHLRTAGQAPEN